MSVEIKKRGKNIRSLVFGRNWSRSLSSFFIELNANLELINELIDFLLAKPDQN